MRIIWFVVRRSSFVVRCKKGDQLTQYRIEARAIVGISAIGILIEIGAEERTKRVQRLTAQAFGGANTPGGACMVRRRRGLVIERLP